MFNSVLRVNGYAAVASGSGWRVIPLAEARGGGPYGYGARGGADSELVTRLIPLDSLPSAEAARALSPFVSAVGGVQAFAEPNAVIVTGYAGDVERVASLARQIDGASGTELLAIPVRYASAEELVEIAGRMSGETGARLAADARSNQILVRGNDRQIDEITRMIAALDTPASASIQTRVFKLANSDAETVTDILSGLVGNGGPAVTNPVAGALQGAGAGDSFDPASGRIATLADNPAIAGVLPNRNGTFGDTPDRLARPERPTSAGLSTPDLSIQAAREINAIVVRGTPGAIAEIETLIGQLDLRRPQVLIEAAIVEITGDAAEQLGVQLGFGEAAPDGSVAATSFSDQGLSLRRILAILGAPAAIGLTEDGLSLGLSDGGNFGVLIQAFGTSSKANLLSTPSLTTLDNEPAEIVVGQNVPFRTGSFTTAGNSTNPFTTIEREDVGITLRVLPRIYDGDVIRLEVTQEVSSLINASVPGASDLVTNRRSIQTTVLADNGGTVVLGGLITDDRLNAVSKVPVLGDIPLAGALFRNTTESGTRRTLFVFLRPRILRTRAEVNIASSERYETLRAAEMRAEETGSLLLNGDPRRLPASVDGIY